MAIFHSYVSLPKGNLYRKRELATPQRLFTLLLYLRWAFSNDVRVSQDPFRMNKLGVRQVVCQSAYIYIYIYIYIYLSIYIYTHL